MKILNVITDLAMGGTEVTLEKIILNDKSNEHLIICLNDTFPIGERLASQGLILIDLKITDTISSIFGIFKIIKFLIKNRDIQVVQGWMYHGNVVAYLINLFLKKKLFWNIRQSLENLSVEKKTTQSFILISKFLSKSKFLDKIIYNSTKGKNDHEKLGFDLNKSHIIFNGYTTLKNIEKVKNKHKEDFLTNKNLPKNTKIVGHIARLHPVKDHINFILTAKKILNKKKNYLFIMIGREVDTLKIKNILRNLNISNYFLLIKETDKTEQYFKIFDLTINTSWAEAFPNVVAESIINNTPCIATKVGDANKILNYDETFLSPPRNPLILSDKIINYFNLDNYASDEKFKKIYFNLVNNFSLKKLIENYNKLFN